MARRPAGVRLRLTLVSLVVVGISLMIIGVSLVFFVHQTLSSDALSTITRQADTTAVLMREGYVPTNLTTAPGTVIQILTTKDSSLVAHFGAIAEPTRPVSNAQPPPYPEVVQVPASGVFGGSDGTDLAVGTKVLERGVGTVNIFSAASLEQVTGPTRVLELSLIVALPLVLLLTGLIAYLLAGFALRPVEAIRAEVADISSKDLNRRVPVPNSGDEIDRLANTMNEMLERLEHSTEDQRRFISDASHELKSPLASMLTQVEVARAHPSSADWNKVSAIVLDEGNRLHHMVDDLLLLARSDERQLNLDLTDVDLDELVFAEADRLKVAGTVQVEIAGVSAARITGDREMLRRMVRNLVDNAARYADSTVHFEVRIAGPTATLVVADDGPGVPEDKREEIFSRFARADKSRFRRTGGTGLGLSIVHEIVTAHGGRVYVAPSVVGARFVVELPTGD